MQYLQGEDCNGLMIKQNSLPFMLLKSKDSTYMKEAIFIHFFYSVMIMLDILEQPFLVLINSLFLLQSQDVHRDDAEGKSEEVNGVMLQ